MYDLSIVIPALREEFISNTVEDIIKNKRGKTEVIVVLDGEWADPGIADHPDVRIIKLGANAGQRGATNIGVKLSEAKYVAKCDAHCAFDEGFDVKLMESMEGHPDWTIVPTMRNMHVFNWRCMDCGDETYQGPVPEGCKNCNVNTPDRFKKVIVWRAKPSPNSTAYRFTPDRLQFKYFGELKRRQKGDLVETMSLQGSFFMLTREKYWELNICDESWGGWGQQGTEVALKTWLSGGTVMVHRGTWYAHMFRTQDGFAFPWGNPGKQQRQARKESWDVFYKNQWPLQVRPLSWLIDKFWDALQAETYQPDRGDRKWTAEDLDKIRATEGRFKMSKTPMSDEDPTRGILYFTDNELPLKYARPVQKRLREIAEAKGLELVSSSRKPMDKMGKNVTVDAPRGYETMFRQILKGLEVMESDIVFMAEHDVMYPPEHFDTYPKPGVFLYDTNWWKLHEDGYIVHWDADQVSGLCAYRQDLIDWYRAKVESYDSKTFDRKFEPLSGEGSEQWKADVPHIDIRHGRNLTYNKRGLEHFRKKETAVNFTVGELDKINGWSKEELEAIIK